MSIPHHQYPIESALPELTDRLAQARAVVLSAPPGAGKTTQIPPALLHAPWLNGKTILMLEPRRLAARRAAEFMAAQAGEDVGRTIGYRIRGESLVGPHTRVEVVTEGILTRMLQQQPDLPGVGLVIFDEFHERSIHADLGLAFACDVQEHLRDDLRLLVMSATLDGVAISRLLDDAPIVEGSGFMHPVETRYQRFRSDKRLEERAVDAIVRALADSEGDILVFLPGRGEIRRVEETLYARLRTDDVRVHCLFGEAPYAAQLEALTPAISGIRKIILSTSIAETSLTIDGVRTVIDCGLARTARFDPRRGMSGLVTVPVSRATADQRRGRAGRQQPGTCYRLWTEEEHASLPEYPVPEIRSADLAPLALELVQWGTPDGSRLRFLDPPPAPHLAQAGTLLRELGALDHAGALTAHGRAMAELPVHPRLAHMILKGRTLGCGAAACDLAALLEEREPGSGRNDRDIDLASRWERVFRGGRETAAVRERIGAEARRLRALIGVTAESRDDSRLGLLLAFAYPDRIARRKGTEGAKYQLAGGMTAVVPPGSLLRRSEYLAVGDVDGIGTDVRIYLAAPLEPPDLETFFADDIETAVEVRWNSAERCVLARRVRRLESLILSEQSIDPDGEQLLDAMTAGVRELGLQALPWPRDAVQVRDRCRWIRGQHVADFPDFSDETLLASLEEWLRPYLANIRRASQLASLDMQEILLARLTHSQRGDLERLAPTHVTTPAGSRIALEYGANPEPSLSVKLQEMFGQRETPRVGGGRIPVLLHLLSPAGRPLAVTKDLVSFWTNVYPEIRTQMRARYPKHIWPENPFEAVPTNLTKRAFERRHGTDGAAGKKTR